MPPPVGMMTNTSRPSTVALTIARWLCRNCRWPKIWKRRVDISSLHENRSLSYWRIAALRAADWLLIGLGISLGACGLCNGTDSNRGASQLESE